MSQSRQPKGVPTGGQFAPSSHEEASPLLADYAYEERTTDSQGEPFGQMAVGESRGAIRNDEPQGLSVRHFRFENGERIVTLVPETKHDSLESYESRALRFAHESYVLATVKRERDFPDWRTKKIYPLYVVTLERSVKNNQGEYDHLTFEQEFVNPRGIPGRADAILVAAETATEYERYRDEEDYIYQSDREPEDAAADYAELHDRATDLRAFLGDEAYEEIVKGKTPEGVRYEIEEPSA